MLQGHSLIHCVAFVTLNLGFSAQAWANEKPSNSLKTTQSSIEKPTEGNAADEALKLDEKQAEALGRLSKTSAVGDFHGRFVVVRDTYFYGPQGVKVLAETWFQRTSTWLNAWDAVVAKATQSTQIAHPQVREAIREAIHQQQNEWAAIGRLGQQVSHRAEEGVKWLNQMGQLNPTLLPAYAPYLESLNHNTHQLRQALQISARVFGEESLQKYAQVIEPALRGILAQLRRAVLNSPELTEALGMVEEAFKAERYLEPALRDVKIAYEAFMEHLRMRRVFHGEAALADLEKRVAVAAQKQIRDSQVDPLYQQPILDKIQKMVTLASQTYSNALRTSTKAESVNALLQRELKGLTAQCRQAETIKHVNCEVVRLLLPLTPQVVMGMSEEELKSTEYLLDKAKEGPLAAQGEQK